MITVILIIHIILALAIIILVLLQKSEGGGLGIGGSTSGGFMTARGTANALTRLTTLFGAFFFLSSIVLAILAGGTNEKSITEDINNKIEVDKKDDPIVPTGN